MLNAEARLSLSTGNAEKRYAIFYRALELCVIKLHIDLDRAL